MGSRTRTPVRGVTRPEPRDSGDVFRDLVRSVEEIADRQMAAEAQLDELTKSLATLSGQLREAGGAEKERAKVWKFVLGIVAALIVAAAVTWLRWRAS